MEKPLSVFLCSTYSDLNQERKTVLNAVRKLQLHHDSMEFFGARSNRPIETCLSEVRRSDILVVIVGHKYGSIVPGSNISFSEAEYYEGYRLSKPCLIYIRDDSVPVLPAHFERDPQKYQLLEKFKSLLRERHTISVFSDPHDLAVRVAADLGRTIREIQNRVHIDSQEASSHLDPTKYRINASSRTPQLVLFLIDIGYHMRREINGTQAINLVNKGIEKALIRMVTRSAKGKFISPRYNLGIYLYTSKVLDVAGGIESIGTIAQRGRPILSALNESSDTYNAFAFIERVLEKHLPDRSDYPAPLLCHITAGEYPGRDPEPVTSRIKSFHVDDGSVLVENILIDDEAVLMSMKDAYAWPGIREESELAKSYARQLFRMSSIIPESYRSNALDDGYDLALGSKMLYPGTQTEMISLGLTFPSATPVLIDP